MDLASFIFSIGPQFLLLLAALRFRQRRKLPKLLVVGLTLALIFSLPMVLQFSVGVERMQTLLFELFPNANDPDGTSDGTSYMIENVSVGQLYIRLLEFSHYIASIPYFFIGLGFYQYVRQEIRTATPEHPPHLQS